MNSESSTPNPSDTPSEASKTVRDRQVIGRAIAGFISYVVCGSLVVSLRWNWTPLILLLAGAVVLAIKRMWPGFALGVFIGVGLTLLAMGICFAVVMAA